MTGTSPDFPGPVDSRGPAITPWSWGISSGQASSDLLSRALSDLLSPLLASRGKLTPAEVARRAGHSIAVLFRFYAKAIHRNQQRSNDQIERALEAADDD
ncbi:hypothetical protein AB5L52_00235 [Streptomyces sp. CG4]|uniref:hypothetical protein n=1 Tax=Streptomyces sp. CG4 TaxID=408783 RepID=UPI0034E2BF34